MADTVITVFVEGDTEIDFYKKLIAYLREKNGGRLNCKVEVKNVKGVGNYQSKVCRIFEKSVFAKNPSAEHKVVLCYDSDVFEFSRKPPVDWQAVTKALKARGAREVRQVKAVTSIEDWFLYDPEGLRSYLKLPKKFKMTGYKGQKGLELVNDMYIESDNDSENYVQVATQKDYDFNHNIPTAAMALAGISL